MTSWQEQLVDDARAALPEHVFRFFSAGALDEVSLAESLVAWRDVRLWPRVLQDVGAIDTATTILGQVFPTPLGIAPTSMQRLAHRDGELEMMRAAAAAETLVVVSSNAGTRFEDLGAVGAPWWLQAYATADRSLIAPTIERAAGCGASAVVLTLDTPVPGPKRDIDDAAFGDLSQVYGLNHPDAVRGATPGAEHARDLSASDIAWLGDLTGLPVVVKGVLRPDDAQRCVQAGADAIWVSNHGGRQLDRSVASRTALPLVAAAVTGAAEVYVDGGIRSGLDALSALALGADAVFLGRLPLLALSAGGAPRIQDVVSSLREELEDALMIAGCPRAADAASVLAPPVTSGR